MFIILGTPKLTSQHICLCGYCFLSLWLSFFLILFLISFHISSLLLNVCFVSLCILIAVSSFWWWDGNSGQGQHGIWSYFIYRFLCPQGIVAIQKVLDSGGLRVDCIWLIVFWLLTVYYLWIVMQKVMETLW